MSDVFDTCESNFLKNIRFVQKQLTQKPSQSSTHQQISESLSDATQQLNKMQIEYSMCQDPSMRAKIQLYKEELRSYKKKVADHERTLAASVNSQHLSDELLEQRADQVGAKPLLDAVKQMYEMKEMSEEAAVGIKANNEKLMKNINRMGDINANLTVAQKLLGSIKRKMAKNKYILYGTICMLVLVLIFVIYTYVAPSETSTSTANTSDATNDQR